MTHVTPREGTGSKIAKEVVTVVQERGVKLQVLGMDGCSVNTGIHRGVFRCVEVLLGYAILHVVCLLHCVELFFHHVFINVDGMTLGPDKLEGPIGRTLSGPIWEEPIVKFEPVPGKVLPLPDEVVANLSRDQQLAYRWGLAIQTGVVPDTLAGQTIGPLVHSRWLTRAVRTLARYTRVKNPTKKLKRIVFFIVNFYLPTWFQVKSRPHLQDGARHLQFMLELSRGLCCEEQVTVKKVLQDNAYFAHPENVAVACLSDNREEVRRRGVRYILESRKAFNPEHEVRKFAPPLVNFQSQELHQLVDLETVEKTEPPVTKEMSEETVLSALATPLELAPYPNNTQRVEQMVRVVTEAATQRATFQGRNRLILQLLESRRLVPKFKTKKQDAVFE